MDFGNPEAALVAVLTAALDTTTFPTVRASTDLIGMAAGQPWVRVSRAGGVPTRWMNLDNPVMDFDVMAGSKPAAAVLAEAVRSAVFAARGYSGHGLAIFDVTDIDGPVWSPDPIRPGLARYTLKLSLVTRPA
jgi:hypothetical protein